MSSPVFAVYAAPWTAIWPAPRLHATLALLPSALHTEILRWNPPADRQNRALARLLLRHALREHGLEQLLPTWQRDAQGRPFFPTSSACPAPPDISCAHAPGLAAVALGLGVRVGIDAEPAHSRPTLAPYADIFSAAEFYFLEASPPSARPFATLWTRKEALCKLDGRGLTAATARINALSPATPLYALEIHTDYVCHLATSIPCPGTVALLKDDFWGE